MEGYSIEPSSDTLSIAVLETIAAREGVDPTAVRDPLYGVVDPEALDSLFQNGHGRVVFAYHGYEVTVSSEGCITLQRSADS